MSVCSQATDGQLTDGLFITRRHLMQGETEAEASYGEYKKRNTLKVMPLANKRWSEDERRTGKQSHLTRK